VGGFGGLKGRKGRYFRDILHFCEVKNLAKCWMARTSKRLRRLWDTYSFEGFRPEPVVRGIFGDPKVRIVTLKRRSKEHRVDAVAASRWDGTTAKSGRCVRGHANIA
jgi:hypothetical protein